MIQVRGVLTLCWECPNCEDNNREDLEEGQNGEMSGWIMKCTCQSCKEEFEVKSP